MDLREIERYVRELTSDFDHNWGDLYKYTVLLVRARVFSCFRMLCVISIIFLFIFLCAGEQQTD